MGHPIHPMLIPFPLGLLATSVAFDAVRLLTANGKWGEIAHWMIAAGVVGGLAAAPFGLVDRLAIPAGARAKSVGLWHGAGNLVVVVLFAVSWLCGGTRRATRTSYRSSSPSWALASPS